MAGTWHRQVGELAGEPHQPQILLQDHAHGAVEAGDGEDLLLSALTGGFEVIQGWPCCGVRRGRGETMGVILPQLRPSAEPWARQMTRSLGLCLGRLDGSGGAGHQPDREADHGAAEHEAAGEGFPSTR